MKQIRLHAFGDDSTLTLSEATIDAPGPSEVAVSIHAIGVNPADAYVRSGGYEFLNLSLPLVPGFDAAGVIIAVGASVTEFVEGDRVWISTVPSRAPGTYASELICDVTCAHALPDHLSFEEGAAVGIPYTTAVRALVQRGGARAGETALVHGASGGVGLPSVQIARALGLRTIGTAGTLEGLAAVAANGADHVFDHSRDGYLDEIIEVTDRRGVDLVVEMTATSNIDHDLRALAPGGRVVIVGAGTSTTIHPRRLMTAEADIRGTAVWNMTRRELLEAYSLIQALLFGRRIAPVVGDAFTLENAADAHRHLATRGRVGKIVLVTPH